jgi:multiple sugar transport system permease protein
MIRRRTVDWSLNALTYFVLALMLAPIVWLVLSSLQTSSQLATGTYDFANPTLDAFRTMWDAVDFERYFRNSVIICVAAAALATAFAASAGYASAARARSASA